MRHITQNGVDQIKRFESFSRAVYFCPAGYLTIGYGHVVEDDEDFSVGIDETQAKEFLSQDVIIAERVVLRLINAPLTDGQFDALPTILVVRHPSDHLYAVTSIVRNIAKTQSSSCSGSSLGLKLKKLVRRQAEQVLFYN